MKVSLFLSYILQFGNISSIFVSDYDITQVEIDMGTTNQALTEAVYYILMALQKPLHGYGIMQVTSEISNKRLVLSAGTLYGAISNLIDKGWIQPFDQADASDSRRKEYLITDEGKRILEAELERLQELVNNGNKHIIR